MSENVAAYMLNRLIDWGVERVYGYPGDGINGLLGAFHDVGDRLEFVQVRHEEIAAFAATAHAKFTDDFGVCMATSGPGAIHLLNGLYDAKLDKQPVVAIVGQQPRTALGADYQQEVDLVTLFKDVAHEFVHVCNAPAQARHLIDRAIRVALTTRSPACIIVPADVQEMPYSEPGRTHGTAHSGIGYTKPRTLPGDAELRRAAEILNAGEKVAMLIGQGAIGAEREVMESAELLGCGVAKALNGRAALPDTLPYVTGSIGLLGTKPSNDMIEGCDTFLMVDPPALRFFTGEEAHALRAFCDTVTAQDADPRIPVLELADAKLDAGKLPGYQYAGMPDDRDTWRLAARGLDEAARERGADGFAAASQQACVEICSAFSSGELSGGAWERLDVERAWSVLMRDTLDAFYSHPWSWSEIGFPGPAYPRGYSRLGAGLTEQWEGEEAFELDPVEDVRRRDVDR
jgi:hypothetical protein